MKKQMAMLDALMGTHRNMAEKDKRGDEFVEASICKHYLVGFCPDGMLGKHVERERAMMSKNDQMPVPCTLTHSPAMKALFEQHKESEKYREKYEGSLLKRLDVIIADIDRMCFVEKKKCQPTEVYNKPLDAKLQKLHDEVSGEKDRFTKEAADKTEAGDTAGAEEAAAKIRELTKRLELMVEEQTVDFPGEECCQVCSMRYLLGRKRPFIHGQKDFSKYHYESEHFDHKLHLGYAEARKWYAKLREKREAARKAKEEERSKRSGSKPSKDEEKGDKDKVDTDKKDSSNGKGDDKENSNGKDTRESGGDGSRKHDASRDRKKSRDCSRSKDKDRSRSREKKDRSKGRDRKDRSRSKGKKARSKSRDKKGRSRSRNKKGRSRSKEKKSRSRSRDKKGRSASRDKKHRSRSRDKKDRSRSRAKKDRSRSGKKKGRSGSRDKKDRSRSRDKKGRSRSRAKKDRSRSKGRKDRSSSRRRRSRSRSRDRGHDRRK